MLRGGSVSEEGQSQTIEQSSKNASRTSWPSCRWPTKIGRRNSVKLTRLVELCLRGASRGQGEVWRLTGGGGRRSLGTPDKLWRLGVGNLLRHHRRGRSRNGQSWQGINIYGISPLLNLVPDINSLLCGDEVDQLIAILTHNHRSEVTGHVVPGDAVLVLVVEDG